MRLFVLGNISSGKSYIIENIRKVLPNYDILKIDEYRKKACSGSLADELEMWEEFPKEILKHDNVIVELSGGGRISENITQLLEENSFLVLKVNTDLSKCLQYNQGKDFTSIPYPKEFSIPIEETIASIDDKIKNGMIESLWKKAINIISVDSGMNVSNLPLMQYHELFKLKKSLNEIKGSLFVFGSTGRGKMKSTSDVDTYFLTEVPKKIIKEELEKSFDSVHIMGDEFVIRENGVLLEMNWIDDISKSDLFYNRSLIEKPSKTILKDDYYVLNHLIDISKNEFDKEKEIVFTMERLEYYVESLPTLIAKGDEYKYFFHNNIVVHEYVKLKAFMNEVFEFSYLPLYAKQYLTSEEWKNIIFMFGDDQMLHYKIVHKMADEVIKNIILKYKLNNQKGV